MARQVRIYLAGGISKVPNYREMFTRYSGIASATVKEILFDEYPFDEQPEVVVVSPLDCGRYSWLRRLCASIPKLIGCQYVYFIPGWIQSRGARLENLISVLFMKRRIFG